MTAFRFRLDPVLEHRARIERERAAAHAIAATRQRAAERVRDELATRRNAARATFTREQAHLDLSLLRASSAHLEHLERALAAAQRGVDACGVETERTRLQLLEAARDCGVLERLKLRRREVFELEAHLAEETERDEQCTRPGVDSLERST